MNHAASQEPGDAGESYDLIAIGCGPFNLGLAALASKVPGLRHLVLEARPHIEWHRGLMFDDAKLQVSFLADMVTLVDPTHPLSFLEYLRESERLYAFYVREAFHPTRREYEAYLGWVASKLSTLRLGRRVTRIDWHPDTEEFALSVTAASGRLERLFSKALVLGIGTEPVLPPALAALAPGSVVHSANYLERVSELDGARHVSVVGSGQSGAEIVLDLLKQNLSGGPALAWLTRSRAFAPLDYTKLTLEMTTPEYVRYFHGLGAETRQRLVREQWQHYKGISSETLEVLYGLLYERELHTNLEPVELRPAIAVEDAWHDATGGVILKCRQLDTGELFEHRTERVIAATGYRERRPTFLEPIEHLIVRDEQGRYDVRLDYSVRLDETVSGRIYVVNAELHTHGVATPDLGISAFRNGTILNSVMRREVYRLPRRTAFSTFAPGATEPALASPGFGRNPEQPPTPKPVAHAAKAHTSSEEHEPALAATGTELPLGVTLLQSSPPVQTPTLRQHSAARQRS